MSIRCQLIFGAILQWISFALNSPNIIDCTIRDSVSVQLICGESIDINHGNCFTFFLRESVSIFRDDIRALITGNCQNETLDADLLRRFRRLEMLDISDHGIVNLPRELPNISELKSFNASGNTIKILPNTLFARSNRLLEMDFSRNRIEIIPDLKFGNSMELTVINFSENDIATLKTGTFSSFGRLKRLNLSYNQIAALDKDMFAHNTLLELLILSHNQLKQFECAHLLRLQIIDLSHNHLTQINFTFLAQDYRDLREIYLEANDFEESIDGGQGIGFRELSVLHISSERIDCTNVVRLCNRWRVNSCSCNHKKTINTASNGATMT